MSRSPVRRLAAYARPYRGVLAAAMVGAAVASTLDGLSFALLIPFLRGLFGVGLPAAPTGVERVVHALIGWVYGSDPASVSLRQVALLLLGVVLLKNAGQYFSLGWANTVREGIARDLRGDLYGHIQKLGLGFYHRTRGGDLVSRVLADVDQAKMIMSQSLVSALQNTVVVLVYLAILCSISWRLTLVVLLLAPTIALMLRPVLRSVRARARAMGEARADMAAVMAETVEGARLVKAHGAERYERRRFEERLDRYVGSSLGAQGAVDLAHPLSETLGGVVIVLLLTFGAPAAMSGNGLRPELFLAFLAVTLRLLPPVKALSQFPSHALVSVVAAERVFEVVDVPPDDVDPPAARPFQGLERDIVFDDVWFAYHPDAWVLRGVRLRIQRGEVVALVGLSGSGKSTLVDLLPRFIDPVRGAVRLDGVPTTTYGRRSLRRAMGIVSQHTVIFHDTIRANIAYGDQADADPAAIEAAARAANAHAFIERLPAGYDTVVGERGARLSGGERQRIAIARALLRDPPLLILDEATSALDTESERLVQDALQRLMAGRTVLVIAHRLSTVIGADRIAVLDGGVISEAGSHAELVAAGGVYQRLHEYDLAGRTE